VSPRAVARAARVLPLGQLELLPGRGHELLREADPIRHRVLARIDQFLG
jgi:lysophospholipase